MLRVCVVVDVEGFISFKQGNPSWNRLQRLKGGVNNAIKFFRYDKNGFERIYNLVLRENFPCSFMLVGSLCHPKPQSPKFIDWGYHTLNHKPLTLISDEELNQEVRNICNAVSFSAPMWMIEDVKNPSRIFKALKKEGYKIALYRGCTSGTKNEHECRIAKPIDKYGVTCVYTSNWFDGERGHKVEEISREILVNYLSDCVYCITTHDFSNKNLKNFEFLIEKLKQIEKLKKIEIVNLAQLVK